jgi:hypothetical protein
MNTRKRVSSTPLEDIASPSKKADRTYTSSSEAISEKAVTTQNNLRGLIGAPMTKPTLSTTSLSISKLSWNGKTIAAMTGVVKSQEMTMDSEVPPSDFLYFSSFSHIRLPRLQPS